MDPRENNPFWYKGMTPFDIELAEEFFDAGWDNLDEIKAAISAGLEAALAEEYRNESSLDNLADMAVACQAGIDPTVVGAMQKVGYTSISEIVEVRECSLSAESVEIFAEMGITETTDLIAVSKAGYGYYPGDAAALRDCGYTTAAEILATQAAAPDWLHVTRWPDQLEEIRALGPIGGRLLKVHPMPVNMKRALPKSSVLEGMLDELDDGTLKAVVSLFEEEDLRYANATKAKRYVKAFTI